MSRETPDTGAPKPLRLGLIGCGRLGSGVYLPAIAASTDFELAAIAENDVSRGVQARGRAKQLTGSEVEFFPSARSLVGSTKLDAVVIASPADQHMAHAEIAAAANLPALIEKPPALDPHTAGLLVSLDPAPMVAFNRRFVVPAEFLRASGPDLRLDLELNYLRWRWRSHAGALDALDDVGSHLFDLALLILGGEGHAAVRVTDLTPSKVAAEFRGDRGTAVIRCTNNRPWSERFALSGPDGPIADYRVGGLTSGIRSRLSSELDPLSGSIRAQLAAFARHLRGSDPGPLADATEGAAALAALDAARRSSASKGSWTEVEFPRHALALPGRTGTPAPPSLLAS